MELIQYQNLSKIVKNTCLHNSQNTKLAEYISADLNALNEVTSIVSLTTSGAI